jgi:UDP-N-acetylglucosamine 2-epimerase
MSSNSIRISSDLFQTATDHALVMSRSTAQQVEHWARLGITLEASGLTVDELKLLLELGDRIGTEPAAAIWAFKRERQQRDIASIEAGRRTNSELSWFTEEVARKAVVLGEPF